METKRGGKRVGAGRKSIAEKKVIITLYVKGSKVLSLGSIEKTKDFLYNYLENVTELDGGSFEIKDLNIPTSVIKPIEPPKINYSINTMPPKEIPVLSEYSAFKDEILKTETIPQIESVMKRVKGALMFPKQKLELESIAKKHSKQFYTD